MNMWLYTVLFYLYAVMLVGAALAVVVSRNPIRGVLFLILCFFLTAVLWMMLEAEFLSLVLIFVYVGAVMTLFLFVVMMLNVDWEAQREGFVRYLPFGVLLMLLLVGLLMVAIVPAHFTGMSPHPVMSGADHSNVSELGVLLYTHYMLAFELASVLLLVGIISAIGLAFRGRQDRLSQNIPEQLAANPRERVRLVKMRSEKR